MTIEEILKCSAEQLEKLSDKELTEHFAPYLQYTRPSPELKANNLKNNGQVKKAAQLEHLTPEEQTRRQRAKAIAAQLGLDDILNNL